MEIPKNGVFFFDSGIGGLTVLAECRKRLPSEIFYYYGDNTRAPYGNLSKDVVRSFVEGSFCESFALAPKAAVIACNTATAVCAESLRAQCPFPVVGAEPAVALAAKAGGEVLALTTRATYESERFRVLCRKTQEQYPQCRLSPYPCDGLAGEIERHIFDSHWEASPLLPTRNPDSVVLGCTHYVYIKETVAKKYGVAVYDGNAGIAERLCAVIENIEVKQRRNTQKDACYFDGIFFLGRSKWLNKYVYEQMFAIK